MPGPELPVYPGAEASISQLLALAEEYHNAYNQVSLSPNSGRAHASAPARLLAIQAIELYLNVYLRHAGESPQSVRGLQHDLGRKTALAVERGLVLRQRTIAHLMDLTSTREYLASRYGPELSSTWSNMNRIRATLHELFRKIQPKLLQYDTANGNEKGGSNHTSTQPIDEN